MPQNTREDEIVDEILVRGTRPQISYPPMPVKYLGETQPPDYQPYMEQNARPEPTRSAREPVEKPWFGPMVTKTIPHAVLQDVPQWLLRNAGKISAGVAAVGSMLDPGVAALTGGVMAGREAELERVRDLQLRKREEARKIAAIAEEQRRAAIASQLQVDALNLQRLEAERNNKFREDQLSFNRSQQFVQLDPVEAAEYYSSMGGRVGDPIPRDSYTRWRNWKQWSNQNGPEMGPNPGSTVYVPMPNKPAGPNFPTNETPVVPMEMNTAQQGPIDTEDALKRYRLSQMSNNSKPQPWVRGIVDEYNAIHNDPNKAPRAKVILDKLSSMNLVQQHIQTKDAPTPIRAGTISPNSVPKENRTKPITPQPLNLSLSGYLTGAKSPEAYADRKRSEYIARAIKKGPGMDPMAVEQAADNYARAETQIYIAAEKEKFDNEQILLQIDGFPYTVPTTRKGFDNAVQSIMERIGKDLGPEALARAQYMISQGHYFDARATLLREQAKAVPRKTAAEVRRLQSQGQGSLLTGQAAMYRAATDAGESPSRIALSKARAIGAVEGTIPEQVRAAGYYGSMTGALPAYAGRMRKDGPIEPLPMPYGGVLPGQSVLPGGARSRRFGAKAKLTPEALRRAYNVGHQNYGPAGSIIAMIQIGATDQQIRARINPKPGTNETGISFKDSPLQILMAEIKKRDTGSESLRGSAIAPKIRKHLLKATRDAILVTTVPKIDVNASDINAEKSRYIQEMEDFSERIYSQVKASVLAELVKEGSIDAP